MPEFPHWSLSLRFPHQNPIHASLLPHPWYMPRPSHPSRFYHPHNIGWGVQIMKLLIMKFSPLPCYLVPLRKNIVLKILFSHTPTLRSSLNVSTKFHTRNNRQNYSCIYLNPLTLFLFIPFFRSWRCLILNAVISNTFKRIRFS
jgi:hypothetical protein